MTMKQKELHALLADFAEWLQDHTTALETDFSADANGFPILPKDAFGDAVRVLEDACSRLSRITYHVGNQRIEGDPELPDRMPGSRDD